MVPIKIGQSIWRLFIGQKKGFAQLFMSFLKIVMLVESLSQQRQSASPGMPDIKIFGRKVGGDFEFFTGEQKSFFMAFFTAVFKERKSLSIEKFCVVGINFAGSVKKL